jgi:hypothetical protein
MKSVSLGNINSFVGCNWQEKNWVWHLREISRLGSRHTPDISSGGGGGEKSAILGYFNVARQDWFLFGHATQRDTKITLRIRRPLGSRHTTVLAGVGDLPGHQAPVSLCW